MTFANSSDPDKAPQNAGPHLRSKLLDTQVSYQKKIMEKYLVFAIFAKIIKLSENLLSKQIVTCLILFEIFNKIYEFKRLSQF